ncbi:MAG: glycosyltransferase [Myxococcales bacterium]|nr:glycosyltransferase [Myxococcales bacterium]
MNEIVLVAALAWLLLCFWAYQGVFFYLARSGADAPSIAALPDELDELGEQELPSITVLVPCYEEREIIAEKVANTLALQYPADKLEILWCDGGSSDGTVEKLEQLTADCAHSLVLRSPQRGKTQQLRYALEQAKGSIIVQTDCDAELPADALLVFARAFEQLPDAGVLGAWVEPKTDLAEEAAFWRDQNALRRLESRGGVSSVVIAACYAYKREALTSLPPDVIADDVHIAFLCQKEGYASYYLDAPRVLEVRAAQEVASIWRHKFRKAHANLRELARFAGRYGDTRLRWRVVFYSKFLQSWVVPLSLPLGLPVLAWATLCYPLVVGATIAALALTTIGFSKQLASSAPRQESAPQQDGAPLGGGMLTQLKMFAMTILLLAAAGISYPWTKHDSSFKKLPSASQ